MSSVRVSSVHELCLRALSLCSVHIRSVCASSVQASAVCVSFVRELSVQGDPPSTRVSSSLEFICLYIATTTPCTLCMH